MVMITQHVMGAVLLLSIEGALTLDNDQLDAQIFNTFITILFMYMFRAISSSSLGGQIVLSFKNHASYI
jgi:hypothetical protein